MTMHHEKCYQRRGVPADLPPDLCDCRTLRMLDEHGQRTMRLLDAIDATARAEQAEAAVARVRALTYENDDGTEFGHTHDHDMGRYGDPECPACWVADIRRALDGEQS